MGTYGCCQKDDNVARGDSGEVNLARPPITSPNRSPKAQISSLEQPVENNEQPVFKRKETFDEFWKK